MEITGKIINALPAASGVSKSTGNSWMSQSYVLETHEQYPKRVCFEVFGQDKIQAMNIQPGQELTVSFDINAREYNGRWFNSVRAWKVQPAVATQPAAAPMQTQAQPAAQPQQQQFPPQVDNQGMPQATYNQQLPPAPSNSSPDELPF